MKKRVYVMVYYRLRGKSRPNFGKVEGPYCFGLARTHEWTLVVYFKPHLHIKGANKLKMRFILLKFSGICWVLTLSWLLFLTL